MKPAKDDIRRIVKTIGFVPRDGEDGVYYKFYASHSDYVILVDFNREKIIYDSSDNPDESRITVYDRRTSNFSNAENFVVLECVDSLLEKGYAPSCIELEKTYPSGRGHSGQLDILVRTVDHLPFLMIECKTWDKEFDKEHSKMLKNGGQLFAYYANDRAAQYLCLYASRVSATRERQNLIVDIDPTWANLSGVKEIHDRWNKNFKDNGIFESYASPYDVKHKALTYGKLETLKEEDSGKIYNQIMEILRHNAISDKPNAFNKLLNLFVCKIIDEADKNEEDELDFQWLESDTDESLQLRLNDLYKRGMWRFLEIEVIDYEQREVTQKLESIEDANTKQWIMKMYTDTRLKKSPNFAFVEVQDDRTFELNAKVVREIVELLQTYKFRYEQKHEFLGNFFELLLNTSMKQEAGQYFTPVPITRFIISSLPLAELVQKRVTDRQDEPLPTVIDYACGSGHFLTEYMSQMQDIIDKKINVSNTSPRVKNLICAWQGYTKFLWAKDTVYGIDLDNRLVKTTKVSAFFNGDGEANIVWANGLDSFTKSNAFRGKLVGADGKDNGKFDILISNPPYSVDAFKSTIEHGDESFELYAGLTDNSSEIECLFVERMKQLLKVGGMAAVILPNSILTNSGIYAKARAILLQYFKVKAIVEAGTNTFMKTNTSTVILFLERRSNDDYLNVSRAVDRFFATHNDVAVSGIERAFSTFVSKVYEGLTLNDYASLFSDAPSKAVKSHELYEDYAKSADFCAKAIKTEKEKLLYFLLTYDQTFVLVKTGKGKEEKKFLGYEFSERRGHEGLHRLSGGTKLYDEADHLNPQKVSSYIYRSFLDERSEIDKSLAKNVSYGRLSDYIEYGTSSFDKKINLGKRIKIISTYPLMTLNTLVQIIPGVTFDKSDQVLEKTTRVILTADNISNDGHLKIIKEVYLRDDFPVGDEKRLCCGDIFICLSSGSKEHVGKCTMIDHDLPYYAGGFMGILRQKTDTVLMKYLWMVLASAPYREILGQGSTGSNINNLGGVLGGFKIPLPPLDIQQMMVDSFVRIEAEEQKLDKQIGKAKEKISALSKECYQKATNLDKLKKAVRYATERVDTSTLNKENYIGVDNLLPAVNGKRPSDYVPSSGTVIAYHQKDILLSNIRPYLKKAWLADNDGGCSGDVLVLQVDRTIALPEYVFLHVSSDQFFEFEMQNIGSNVKMPRADKKKVLDYPIPLLELKEQERIVKQLLKHETEIARLKTRLGEVISEKESVMRKYL